MVNMALIISYIRETYHVQHLIVTLLIELKMKKAISVLSVIVFCVALSYSALAQQNTQATYAKSDFVPGDVIFFEDTFENEKLGEFPSQWDLLDGYSEMASVQGRKVLAFTDDGIGSVIPLMKNK